MCITENRNRDSRVTLETSQPPRGGWGTGGAASVFIFHDWWIAVGVMIDGINVALATLESNLNSEGFGKRTHSKRSLASCLLLNRIVRLKRGLF